MKRNSVLLLLFILLLLVAVACGCHIWRDLHAREKEQQVFEKLEKTVALPEPPKPPEEETAEEPQESQPPVSHDCDTLATNNVDCIGWLSIPDTVVSYPVMYSPSEPERYLHLDFYGRYSYSGTPFLDARCDPYNGNLIIYGHNMINGTMFGSLKRYRNADYLNSHKIVYLEQPDGVHMFEVFSVVTLEKDDAWYSFLHAADADEEAAWISDLERNSGVHTYSTPAGTERLLTLSTCTGNRKSERMIVVAKEVKSADDRQTANLYP